MVPRAVRPGGVVGHHLAIAQRGISVQATVAFGAIRSIHQPAFPHHRLEPPLAEGHNRQNDAADRNRREPIPLSHRQPHSGHRAAQTKAKRFCNSARGPRTITKDPLFKSPARTTRRPRTQTLFQHFQFVHKVLLPGKLSVSEVHTDIVPPPCLGKSPKARRSLRKSVRAKSSERSPRAVRPAASGDNASPSVPQRFPQARAQTSDAIPIPGQLAATGCDEHSGPDCETTAAHNARAAPAVTAFAAARQTFPAAHPPIPRAKGPARAHTGSTCRRRLRKAADTNPYRKLRRSFHSIDTAPSEFV